MTDSPSSSASVPSIVLRVAPASADQTMEMWDAQLAQVNDLLFNRLGVIVPPIERQITDAYGPKSSRLYLGEADIGSILPAMAASSIVELLARYADRLINPVLVEFYLSRLQSRTPALVAAIRARFSIEEIVEKLQTRVRAKESIKDLAGVLNDELAASVNAPAQPAPHPPNP